MVDLHWSSVPLLASELHCDWMDSSSVAQQAESSAHAVPVGVVDVPLSLGSEVSWSSSWKQEGSAHADFMQLAASDKHATQAFDASFDTLSLQFFWHSLSLHPQAVTQFNNSPHVPPKVPLW